MKILIISRRKFKIFLLITVTALIVGTVLVLRHRTEEKSVTAPLIEIFDNIFEKQQQNIIPEKYNEHELRNRIITDKIDFLTKSKDDESNDLETSLKVAANVTRHVHIYYSVPITWYKKDKTSRHTERIIEGNSTSIPKDSTKFLNIAFYPSLGLYKPTENIFRTHFQNIKDIGIGVIIVQVLPKLTEDIFTEVLKIAGDYNLRVTIEITAQNNRTLEYLKHQIRWAHKFLKHRHFYKVYSVSKGKHLPMIYVRNAHKIPSDDRFLCLLEPTNIRKNTLDAIFLGQIRLKQHADLVRRLCFDGFYTRSASNGASYASTWKNWSYLKAYASTYRMLFVPTVGAGYSERNKPLRHGNIQRHRSNGRYYGVAWRTAITNHIGFISINSYNNWPEGTQIEEAIPKTSFIDYSPGKPTKYLDLTNHWIENFINTEPKTQTHGQSCYELFNNTIC